MMSEETIPQDLFHYTKSDTALEIILPSKKLRLGQLGFTNDPRESKPWNILKLNPNREYKNANPVDVSKVLDEMIPRVMKEEWKVLCFTAEVVPRWINEPLEKFRYRTHGYAHPRMWAQYAENHRGVCLWFDGNKINDNINRELSGRCKIFHGKVDYDVPPGAFVLSPFPQSIFEDVEELGGENAARKYVFDNYEYFFLRKHLDWESEAEYRWLIHSNKPEPEFVSIVDAIKGILIGIDFPDTRKPLLIELCKELKISAGDITYQNGMPVANLNSIYMP